jgi:hypothetical protein
MRPGTSAGAFSMARSLCYLETAQGILDGVRRARGPASPAGSPGTGQRSKLPGRLVLQSERLHRRRYTAESQGCVGLMLGACWAEGCQATITLLAPI